MTKLNELSEKALIRKSKRGDTAAFEELMSRTRDYLTAWINGKTNNQIETEEVLQITYIKCWKNIKKFKGISGFKTWACSISRNLFIDIYRKKQKSKELSLEEVSGAYEYHCSTPSEAIESLKNEDLKIALNEILSSLPKIHRDVLSCFAVEELSYKEISKKLGCSVGTVMSRLFYARKKAQQIVLKNKELKPYAVGK
tara:strand:- start:687 stop:1280 length:594 start_codon:yes stop_codon:yes gene_type:complete